jgi:hypothetical protein
MTRMPTRREFLWAAGAMALLPAVRRVAFAAGPIGSVAAVQGPCVIERQGRSMPLKMGDAVAVGDAIAAQADGRVKLAMSDKSAVSLASATRVTLAAYEVDAAGQRQQARLALAQGLLRVVVAPANGPAGFEVSTSVGTAVAHSTDWFIEALPGSAQVGVLSGSVSLTSGATGRSVTIPGRWGARLEAGRDPVMARVWGPSEFQGVISRTDVR